MTTTLSNPKTLDADDVSRILTNYLCVIGDTDDTADPADVALGQILKLEAEELVELSGEDDIYPTLLLSYGVAFGISATFAVLQAPPQEALEQVAQLVSELKADMRDRIDPIRIPKNARHR